MNPYGSSCVLMGLNGFVWVLMHGYRSLWVLVCLCGSFWVFMDLYVFLWVLIGFYGFICVFMCLSQATKNVNKRLQKVLFWLKKNASFLCVQNFPLTFLLKPNLRK